MRPLGIADKGRHCRRHFGDRLRTGIFAVTPSSTILYFVIISLSIHPVRCVDPLLPALVLWPQRIYPGPENNKSCVMAALRKKNVAMQIANG